MKISLVQILVLVIAVILIIVVALQLSAATPTISSNTTVKLAPNATYNFKLPDNNNVSSLFLLSSLNGSMVLYFSKTPVLINDISVIRLSGAQVVNISTNGGQYADLQISAISSSPKSATFGLSYIPKTLYLKPSSGIQIINATSGISQTGTQSTVYTTIPVTTTALTTTVTTVTPVNQTLAAIVAANSTYMGILMTGFKNLYVSQASTCTSLIYNNTYFSTFGQHPSGPTDYYNATQQTPRGVVVSAAAVAPSLYNLTYDAVILAGNQPLVNMQFNASDNEVMSYTFKGGLFADLYTYANVSEVYSTLNVTGPNSQCSVYVAT